MTYATKLGAAALVAALALSAGSAQASQRVTEIPLRAQYAVPGDIVAGPDGAMYAADSGLGKVWRIADNGRVRSYDVGGGVTGITSAYGALWVSERDGSQIVKLGLDGTKTAYPVSQGAFPTDIVLGSDGALWFAESRGNAIGRLTKDGDLTEYPLPTPDAFIADLVAGPDGALWFTESNTNKIGRITTAGEITEYTLPGAESMPSGITVGPDGALWFTELNGNKIGRMTTDGVLTHEHPIPVENATPISIVAGPDGAIYYTQHSDGSIARMALDGTVTKRYRLPSGYPDGLGVGPDGDLWFTQGSHAQVGRIDLRWDPPIVASPTTFAMKRWVSAERTVATFTDADPEDRYDVTIKWGDGTTTAGWVRRTANGYEVRGRHTYDRAKTYKVTVRIDTTKVESTAVVK
jgi:virginiamycin B lyase